MHLMLFLHNFSRHIAFSANIFVYISYNEPLFTGLTHFNSMLSYVQEEAMHLAKFMRSQSEHATTHIYYDLSGSSTNSVQMSELVLRLVRSDEI